MSVKATNYVLHNRFGNPTRKLIMLAIADHANDSGEAWPGIENLAYKAECSQRSVQIHLRELETSGDLQIQPPRPPSRMANTYRIIFKNLHPPEALSGKGKSTPADSAPPQIPYTNSYAPRTPTRPESSPEPLGTVIEPSRERAPARGDQFSEIFRDTLARINSLRPEWAAAPGYSKRERIAFIDNAQALESVAPEHWETVRRYLAAKLPQGSAGFQPVSREQFLAASNDVLARALQWERKQTKPAAARQSPPLQTPEEKAQAERDLAEWLAEQTAR